MSSEVRDAATVVVVRDRPGGAEALMVRRHGRSGFAPDAWVFPGGVVDAADCRLPSACWAGIDPDALAHRFGESPALVLGRHVAAVRETFEEAGLLLARRRDGAEADLDAPGVQAGRTLPAAGFAQWVADQGLVLDLGALTYWSRWITPRIEPKRYDTSFFLARAPRAQAADHDRVEVTSQRWVTPAAALAAHAVGDFHMIYPTIRNLEEMAPLATVDALVAHAEARPHVARIIPHFEQTGGAWRVLEPDHPEFPAHLYGEELSAP